MSKKEATRSVSQRMGLAAVILAVSILLSRVLGFLRDAVIANQYGASAMTDAYYAAFTLPDLMNYFLAGGTLSITFIPLFSSYIARNDEEGGWRLFSTVATTMGCALIAVSIFGIAFAPTLVGWLNPGFSDAEQMQMAVTMTRIVIPAQIAFYLGGLLQATLFVREVFWPSAIAPLIYNGSIILGGLLLDPWFGIQGFSIGVVIGALLGPLALPLWAARKTVRFRFRFAPRDADFRAFLWLTLPLMVGVSLVTVDEWLLKYFGSMHEQGAITWLNNSRKLMMVLFAVIGQAAGQAALPYLSRMFHEGKEREMGEMLAQSLQRVIFLSVISAAGLIAVAYPLVHLVFRHGEFSVADADGTAELLVFFSLGLMAWSAQTVMVRGFYARQDTVTPMIIGTVVAVGVLPIYYLLDHVFGLAGLAGATSIGITINVLVTAIVYRRRGRTLPLTPVVAGLGRGLVLAVGGGGVAWAVGKLLTPLLSAYGLWGQIVGLVGMGLGFCGAIGLLAVVIRPPELEFIMRRLFRRFVKAG